MAFEDDFLTDIWNTRRLGEVNRATELPATARPYLALSDLDDDELEEATSHFGNEFQKSGWGMSEVFQDLLSREPDTVQTDDIKSLQNSLKEQGYLPPNHAADGVWDPASNSAFRRYDRDNEEQVRSGKHWLAAPVETGIRALGYTLPSGVFQAILGAAKGLVEQAPQTAERVGLLGGAAGGAALGTAVAPGVGTLIGGIGGAAVGFFSDIMGEDEGEENQSGWEKFVDALSPFEEYKAQGSKAFFEDLGFILTAASIIRGGQMAVGGAQAGMAAAGAAGWLAKAPALQPGLLTRMTASTLGAGSRGLARVGIGSGSGSAGARFVSIAKEHGLIAQTTRPMFRTVNGAFTGLAAGSVGARLSAGLGSGEETSTIERTIKEAPKLPTWVDNTVGMVVFSNRFLPTKPGGMAKGAQSLLTRTRGGREKSITDVFATGDSITQHVDSGVALKPYVHVAQENGLGPIEARDQVLKALGRDKLEQATSDMWLSLDFGVKRRAGEMLNELGYLGDEVNFEKAWTDAVFTVKKQLKDEWANGGDELTKDLFRYRFMDPANTANGPMSFAGHLKEFEGIGSSVQRMEGFRYVNKQLAHMNRDIREGATAVQIRDGLDGYVEDASKAFRAPENFDAQVWRHQRDTLNAEISKLEREIPRALSPGHTQELTEKLLKKQADLKAVKEAKPKTRVLKAEHPYSVTVARKYDPDNHVPGYLTEQDLLTLADDYERKAQKLNATYDRAREARTTEAWADHTLAQDEMNAFAQDLYFRGAVNDQGLVTAKRAIPGKAAENKSAYKTANTLREKATYHAKEVVTPEGMGDEFDRLGYKLIATPDDILLWDEVDNARQAMEIAGVGDYTRRAAFFETLGASPYKHSDRSLFAARTADEQADLHGTFAEHGIKMTGQQGMRKIRDHLVAFNHGEGVQTFGPWVSHPGGGKLRERVSLYRVDTRELSKDDIVDALKLDEMPGLKDVDRAADGIYQSLKRGAAMGAETNLRKPMEAAHGLARALRVNGLPGFSDFMRTFHVQSPARAGAIVGGAGGAFIGGAEEGSDFGDIVRGAAIGAAAMGGLGAALKHKFPKGTYGYLPDKMHKLNMALRYSLSPTFDAGRYVEQNMLAVEHGLPVIINPKNHIMRRASEWGESPDEAWANAINLWDSVNGVKVLRVVDDVDRRMFQKGMLGFSPRYHEAAQMYLLHKQGKSFNEIEQIVSSIGRYGIGRTAAEKSINFLFFPASFQKKFITSMGNFIMQAPARNLLLHESVRMLHASQTDQRFADFLEKHVPFAEQVKRINNLAYGLSPGRFVLEGVNDQQTDFAKAAQIVTSFFVPSGAATPVAQAAGGVADSLTNLFVPIAVTGEDVDGLDDIVNRYVPIGRDIRNFWEAGQRQITAMTEGADPYYQLQHYLDEKRSLKADLEPIATAMGYSSVDGFLQSDAGIAFKAQIDQEETALANKYPTGFRKSQEFENTTAINEQALADLAAMPNKSKAEEDIVRLAEIEMANRMIGEIASLPAELVASINQSQMRRFALERAGDERFRDLWDRFYAFEFGPIEGIKVA